MFTSYEYSNPQETVGELFSRTESPPSVVYFINLKNQPRVLVLLAFLMAKYNVWTRAEDYTLYKTVININNPKY